MAFAGGTVWQATMAIMGVEERLEKRMDRRLTRLEQKVRDDKDKLDRELAADEGINGFAQSQGSDAARGDQAHSIKIGDTERGRLSEGDNRMVEDDSFFDVWRISFDSVQSVPSQIAIEMKSNEIDSYLFLLYGDSVVHADDTGDNLDARLILENVDTTITYIVIANTYIDETGQYTLTVTDLKHEMDSASPPGGVGMSAGVGAAGSGTRTVK